MFEMSMETENSKVLTKDRSQLKPQKSILKTEKSSLTNEKSYSRTEKSSILFNRNSTSFNEDSQQEEKVSFNDFEDSSKKNFLIKDLDVQTYIIGKLPAIPKEYTSWLLADKSKKIPFNQFDNETSQLSDDWSKFSEEVFTDVEVSLKNIMLRREKSCRQRCEVVEKKRNSNNYEHSCNEILDKYDEEIKLDELMKSNKKYSCFKTYRPCNGPNNYKLLLADEQANRKCHCYRFIDKNQKFEQNEIVNMFNTNKRNIFKLPSLKKKSNKKKKKFAY